MKLLPVSNLPSLLLLTTLTAALVQPNLAIFLSPGGCADKANRCGFLKTTMSKGEGSDCQTRCVGLIMRFFLRRIKGWACGPCPPDDDDDCEAENLAMIFLGASSVSSFERGRVHLKWKQAYPLDLDDLQESTAYEDLHYQVFYAKAPFDYLINGDNTTVDDILDALGTQNDLYYVETPETEFDLTGLLVNETYDILVTASCQNSCKRQVYSINRQAATVQVANADPILKPNVTNIHTFDAYATTDDLSVTFGGENNETIFFSGSEMPEAIHSLQRYDVVSGFASEGVNFLCSLVELVQDEQTLTAWKYRTLNPTDIYDYLEFDQSIGMHDAPSYSNGTSEPTDRARARQLGLLGSVDTVDDVWDVSDYEPWNFFPTIDFSKNDKTKNTAIGGLKINVTVKWQPDQLVVRAKGKVYKDIFKLVNKMDVNFHVTGTEKWTYGFTLDLKVASIPKTKKVNLKKDNKGLGVEWGPPAAIHIPIGPTGLTFSFRPVVKPIVNFEGTFNIGFKYEWTIRFKRDTTFKVKLNFHCLYPYICGNEVDVTDKSPGRVGKPDITSELFAKGTLSGQLGFGFYLKDFGINGLRTGDWILELGLELGLDLTISVGITVNLLELELPDFELEKFTAGIYLQPKISALKGLLSYTPGKIFYFTLLALPSVKFESKDLTFCQGSDAISVSIDPKVSQNGLIPNLVRYSGVGGIPTVAWFNLVLSDDWEMDGEFSKTLTVRLPKSALVPGKKPEFPRGDFHLRWTPEIPYTTYTIFACEDEISLSELVGASFMKGFECCEKEHCPSGYACENQRCVVDIPDTCKVDEYDGICVDEPFYCRGFVADGKISGASTECDCCVEEVSCSVGNIFEDSKCIDRSSPDVDCELAVPAIECTPFGEEDARCCVGRVPCHFGTDDMSGYCIDTASEYPSCDRTLPHDACTEFGDDVECCLDDVANKTCVANGKYPGTCTTQEDCLLSDKTPLNNYKGVGCEGDDYCCVDPGELVCKNVGESKTVYGTCLNISACSDDGFEPVTDYIPDDPDHRGQCPGEEDIQCCIDLHYWSPCGKEGIAGECMDRDNCRTSGENREPFSVMGCPGDSEIRCCATLPACTLGETSLTGQCVSSESACTTSGLVSYGGQDCPAQGKPWYVVCCSDPLPACQVSGAGGQCTLSSQCDGILLHSADCPEEEGVGCCLPATPCQVHGFDGLCLPEDACSAESIASTECPLSMGGRCCINYPSCETFGSFIIDYSNGFPCDVEALSLNRYPADLEYPQNIIYPDRPGLCGLRLTPDFVNAAQLRAVSAFTNFQFDADNNNFGFSMTTDYRIFGGTNSSADGLAFVMHQDERGLSALGGPGRFLGVYGGSPIRPAIVVELDTKRNDGDNGESNIQVTRVFQDGSLQELSETHTVEIRTHATGFPNGRLWVDYCGSGMLQVFVNNTGIEKPLLPQSATDVALGDIFSDSTVYLGFTAASGVESDNHDVLSFLFEQSSTTWPTCSFDGVIGSCILGNECEQEGMIPIHANLCPNDIGCCVSLPDCTAEETDGKCMPHDDCTGVSRASDDCPYDPSAVGCCIHKPYELDLDGFPCGTTEDTPPFHLNRNPADLEYPQYVVISGESDRCYIRLTQDSAMPAAASAFLPFSFAVDNPDYVFSMSAAYRIFGLDDGSADGIGFVIHQHPNGTYALGGQGGNMGVYSPSEAITPALVVELDTFYNFDTRLDEGENHIHVLRVHEDSTLEELAQTYGGLSIRTDDTGIQHGRLWVDHCGDGKLHVYFNNTGNDKPAESQAFAYVDLKQIFTGSDVFMGFTSGTYLEGDFHDILSFSCEQSCSVETEVPSESPSGPPLPLTTLPFSIFTFQVEARSESATEPSAADYQAWKEMTVNFLLTNMNQNANTYVVSSMETSVETSFIPSGSSPPTRSDPSLCTMVFRSNVLQITSAGAFPTTQELEAAVVAVFTEGTLQYLLALPSSMGASDFFSDVFQSEWQATGS